MASLNHDEGVDRLITDLDHLINEMLSVRRRVAALSKSFPIGQTVSSVRDAEWFGMWADREDMCELSSRDWLAQLRKQQWRG